MRRAIASIPDRAWRPIRYPRAVFDEQLGQWVSDAEVAEVEFTAFTSRSRRQQVTARLIVRRVRDANPAHVVANAQGELFPAWRYHAVFTDSPLTMLQAEADHRRHAIIEQVIADLKNGPLAHLPSGRFAANGAWLVLAAVAFNLTRAAGALASLFHAKATTATIRRQLINVPARPVRSARRTRLRLPTNWPWADRLAAGCSTPPSHHPPPLPEHPGPAGHNRSYVERPDQPATEPRPSNRSPPVEDQDDPEPTFIRWIRA